ncbi:DUF3488 domain-containing protein, partial [Myxococcota bacterium]|nr:DUF3488 domain-containing protein [Myxococcota bacterium]
MIQGRMKAGMTLGFAYETGLALATTLALLAVLPAQTVPSWLWISLLIPPLAAYLHRHSKTLGSGVTTLAGFLILLIASAFGIQGGLSVLVEVMTATLIGFLALRLLSRNEPRHDIQALLMGFLLFLAGSILQPTLVYGLLFIAFSLAVIWALLTHNLVTGGLFREEELSEDEKESIKKHVLARRDIITPRFLSIVAVLALLILASTVVLFASFPRIGFGRFGFSRQRGISLPQSVSLGGGSMAGGSGEVVARIYGLSYARFERGLYLRGPVFDILKKEGFSRSHKDIAGAPSQLGLHPQGEPFEYEVFLQPVTTKILPILGPSRGVFVIRGGKLHPSMPIRTIGVNAYSEVLTAEPLRGPVRYKINGYFSENGAASGLLN